MISIPQRLLHQPFIQQILSDGKSFVLKKQLSEPAVNREGYISKAVLSMVTKGCQQITTCEEQVIQIPAGTMTFLPKGLYNVSDLFANNEGFESILFFISDDVITHFLEQSPFASGVSLKSTSHLSFVEVNLVMEYFQGLVHILPKMPLIQPAFVQLKILELLYLLEAQNTTFPYFLCQAQQGASRNIKTFMEAHYDKPLRVEDYAYLTGKSVSTFRREFKARFGNTPQKWLIEKRLDKAYEVLIKAESSVTQIAYDTGYDNVSHFIKAFKKKYQLTPKQLLQEHKNVKY
ncbi:AraC family transcriptional regulator [uncultured Microscilla sp.]|uniref:helix-turn-helix domain-containing protein n=1 Tax=uncultured Microscilla sp. TaxID=432653 RepID=UPI0026299FB9|nr:AraC family transcriptional regulator [uncultured Microscilla sp.]